MKHIYKTTQKNKSYYKLEILANDTRKTIYIKSSTNLDELVKLRDSIPDDASEKELLLIRKQHKPVPREPTIEDHIRLKRNKYSTKYNVLFAHSFFYLDQKKLNYLTYHHHTLFLY